MFDIQKHRHNYFYNLATVVEELIPAEICDNLTDRVNTIIAQGLVDHVNHSGLGNDAVSDWVGFITIIYLKVRMSGHIYLN